MMEQKSLRRVRIVLMFARLSILLMLAGCVGGNDGCDDKGSSLTGSLTGSVSRADSPNTAVTGVQLILYPAEGSISPLTTTTDASGTYRFNNIPEGDYTLVVQVTDGGYQQIRVLVQVRAGGSVYDLRLLPSNAQVGGIEISSPAPDGPDGSYLVGKQYLFRARVLDASGQELTGWQPMWRVDGGVGSIDHAGRFTAASAGNGEVVAYLFRGSQVVQARVPIRVREPAGTQSNSWLLVPMEFASGGYGLRAYDARTRQVRRDYPLGARSRPEGLTLSPDGVVYWIDQAYRTVYRIDLRTGQTSAFSLSHPAKHILALADDLLVVVRASTGEDEFFVYDGRSGTPLGDYQRLAVTNTYAMTLGPDGRIYIACRYRENRQSYYGILRYRLEDSALVLDKILTQGTAIPRGIAFAANGDMIVSEGRVLQRYTSEGAPLGGGFALPFNETPEIIHFGRGILQPFDEVLFVLTDKGVWRARYDGGQFSLIPSDSGTRFLSGRYHGCLVWNQ